MPAGTDPGRIVAGQFDASTDSDLAVVNETGDTFSVLFGTGASAATFNAPIPNSLGTGANPRGIAVGEFNGDGDPDLAVGNIGSDEVKVVIGASGVNFNPFATITTGSLDPTFLAAADLDGDGLTELAVGHASSNIISLHTSTGSAFGAPVTLVETTALTGVALRDVDGDGDPELLGTSQSSSVDVVSVRKGLPGVSFGSRVNITAGDGAVSPVAFTQPPSGIQPQGHVFVLNREDGTIDAFQTNDYHLALTSGTLDTVEVGKISTAAQRITFTNDGFGSVTPTAIQMAGNANDFVVTANECVGVTLASGASCDVDVRFAPTAVGAQDRVFEHSRQRRSYRDARLRNAEPDRRGGHLRPGRARGARPARPDRRGRLVHRALRAPLGRRAAPASRVPPVRPVPRAHAAATPTSHARLAGAEGSGSGSSAPCDSPPRRGAVASAPGSPAAAWSTRGAHRERAPRACACGRCGRSRPAATGSRP